jgi:hypothetical protein
MPEVDGKFAVLPSILEKTDGKFAVLAAADLPRQKHICTVS